jgi:hypothetical protein
MAQLVGTGRTNEASNFDSWQSEELSLFFKHPYQLGGLPSIFNWYRSLFPPGVKVTTQLHLVSRISMQICTHTFTSQ